MRIVDRWPRFASQLERALLGQGETALAASVHTLEVVEPCGCGDEACQSFHTAPKPKGAYGPGHRNILLDPPWPGELILDVVNDDIAFVEIIDRAPLD